MEITVIIPDAELSGLNAQCNAQEMLKAFVIYQCVKNRIDIKKASQILDMKEFVFRKELQEFVGAGHLLSSDWSGFQG